MHAEDVDLQALADEVGTPFCVTVDFETVETDQAVTVRARDTMTQERLPIDRLVEYLDDHLDLG